MYTNKQKLDVSIENLKKGINTCLINACAMTDDLCDYIWKEEDLIKSVDSQDPICLPDPNFFDKAREILNELDYLNDQFYTISQKAKFDRFLPRKSYLGYSNPSDRRGVLLHLGDLVIYQGKRWAIFSITFSGLDEECGASPELLLLSINDMDAVKVKPSEVDATLE